MHDATYLRDEIRKKLYHEFKIEISNRGVRALIMKVGRCFCKSEITINELSEWSYNNTMILAAYHFGQVGKKWHSES